MLHPVLLRCCADPLVAVLAYRALPLSHAASKLYHAVMHSCSALCAALALAAVVYYHNVNHYPHLSEAASHAALWKLQADLLLGSSAPVPAVAARRCTPGAG